MKNSKNNGFPHPVFDNVQKICEFIIQEGKTRGDLICPDNPNRRLEVHILSMRDSVSEVKATEAIVKISTRKKKPGRSMEEWFPEKDFKFFLEEAKWVGRRALVVSVFKTTNGFIKVADSAFMSSSKTIFLEELESELTSLKKDLERAGPVRFVY